MLKHRGTHSHRLLSRWQTVFIVCFVILLLLGVLFMLDISLVESATTFHDPYFLLKQFGTGLILGLGCFVIGMVVPLKTWLKVGPVFYVLSIVLLVAVFLPGIGLELNGAHRWLSLGPIRFQPVEFFKLALIFYFSGWLAQKQHLPQFLAMLIPPAILILLQPDLGSLLIVLSIALILYFLAGGRLKQLGGLAALGIPVILVLIVVSPYRLKRLTSFFNPESDPLGASFHIRQITLALGRGGAFGQGLGNSQQKFAYIPESTTDSIFAIIAEEIGFFGSLLLFALQGLLWYSGYKVIQEGELDGPEQLLALGVLSWLVLQALLNLAAVVGLVPLTGIPLPFFSYGRSAQVMTLLACAIIVRSGRKMA